MSFCFGYAFVIQDVYSVDVVKSPCIPKQPVEPASAASFVRPRSTVTQDRETLFRASVINNASGVCCVAVRRVVSSHPSQGGISTPSHFTRERKSNSEEFNLTL